MPFQVTLKSGLSNVVLPDGLRHGGGDVVTLSDDEYSMLSANSVSTLFSDVTNLSSEFTGNVGITGGQLVISDGSPGKMRLGQKNNGEVVWSYNVDQDNGDAIDDPTDSAFKFSMQGLNDSGYDGLHLQHIGANVGSWSGAVTLIKFNGDGTVTIGAYTLPTADGTAGQVLTTNGEGTLAWAAP